MTFDELRKAIGIYSFVPVQSEEFGNGIVTEVSWHPDAKPKGVNVTYPGQKHNRWYWVENTGDSRKRYIDQLEIIAVM